MDSNDILDLEVPVSSIFLLRVLNMFFSEDSQTEKNFPEAQSSSCTTPESDTLLTSQV